MAGDRNGPHAMRMTVVLLLASLGACPAYGQYRYQQQTRGGRQPYAIPEQYRASTDLPPVVRRMEVRPSQGGFAVEGFRATPAGQGRFALTPGMTAEDLRRTMYSVAWDDLLDLSGRPKAFLAAEREVLDGPTETIEVWLDRPDGRAAIVRYTIEPTQFSHFGLLRFLRTVMGPGEIVSDTGSQLKVLYREPGEPTRCWLQATRLGAGPPRWRLQYTLTSTLVQRAATEPAPPPSEPASQPATRPPLQWQEPPAPPMPSGTDLRWRTRDDVPPADKAELDWQHPQESSPADDAPAEE